MGYMRLIVQSIVNGTKSIYNKTHWFTDKEAWAIFRLFAFGEAIGWTLLISAIVYGHFDLPWSESVLIICGRIHGVFFMAYFVVVLITVRSMKWGFWRTSLALLAGVGPYTSLMFEQIMAYHRKKRPSFVEPPASYFED